MEIIPILSFDEEQHGCYTIGHCDLKEFEKEVAEFFDESICPFEAEHIYFRYFKSKDACSGIEIRISGPGRGAQPVTYAGEDFLRTCK